MKILELLGRSEIDAVNLVLFMLDQKNRGDGEGLFSGIERHQVLPERLKIAAAQSQTLREFYSRTFKSLVWSQIAADATSQMLELISVDNEREVLTKLRNDMPVIYAVALEIHQGNKKVKKAERESKLEKSPITEAEVQAAQEVLL